MWNRFALTFAVTMSLFMSIFMSGVVTAINLGIDGEFVGHWLSAWIRVFPIAFVAILVFRPLATRITIALVGPPPSPRPVHARRTDRTLTPAERPHERGQRAEPRSGDQP